MILSQASDLQTRQIIWVSRKVNGTDQSNSHTRPGRTVDGLSAADWAGLSAHAHRADVGACPVGG